MNKKGTDKILSLYWFVILVIIAGGIFAMAYNFYGSPYDVREVEAKLLAEKIANCLSKDGIVNSHFFSELGFNEEISETFLDECNLNFNVESSYGNEIQYFYQIDFYSPSNIESSEFSISGGNKNFENDCYIEKESDEEYSRLSKCVERRLYASDKKGEQHLIKIISAVGKSDKNVKQ